MQMDSILRMENVKRAQTTCIIVLAVCKDLNVTFVTLMLPPSTRMANVINAKIGGPKPLKNQ